MISLEMVKLGNSTSHMYRKAQVACNVNFVIEAEGFSVSHSGSH